MILKISSKKDKSFGIVNKIFMKSIDAVHKRKKVLLCHLNSMGDCLFASIIAHQIKEVDYPDCHLTWAVNTRSRQVIEHNPYIDEIWEYKTEGAATNPAEWENFLKELETRRNLYDKVFITQIIGDNWFNYDGGVRSSIENNYPHKITVSREPIVRLTNEEIKRVENFSKKHRLQNFEKVILVECAPHSFKTVLNPETALEIADLLVKKYPQIAFILSSSQKIISNNPNIIDGSELKFRENAELTKYCHLLLGCGSGISFLTTSDWAKKLQMIQVVNTDNDVLPSVVFDHEYIGLSVENIIEIKNSPDAIEKLLKCLETALKDFTKAKVFHEQIKLSTFKYITLLLQSAIDKNDLKLGFHLFKNSIKRNGISILRNEIFRKNLIYFLRVAGNKLRRKLWDKSKK